LQEAENFLEGADAMDEEEKERRKSDSSESSEGNGEHDAESLFKMIE
jgi:hypothetical protein